MDILNKVFDFTGKSNLITLDDLNPNKYILDDEQTTNQYNLWIAVNQLRLAYNKPMIVTSGVRSKEDQQRINPKAPLSKHIIGAAVDFSDPNGDLKKFVKENNYKILIDNGLWMEAASSTPNWLHVQVFPPKSGKREFLP